MHFFPIDFLPSMRNYSEEESEQQLGAPLLSQQLKLYHLQYSEINDIQQKYYPPAYTVRRMFC